MPHSIATPPAGASRGAAQRLMAGLCALSVSGCATVQPQIFSEELSPADAVAAPAVPEDLPAWRAIAQAEALQRLYIKAVKDQSGVNAGTSAALIGLSALGLIRGITVPNGRDLAVLGVAGSGLYAYASTLTSKPRQLVYLAGAETLNCAIAATTPYVLPAGFLVAADPRSSPDDSVTGLIRLAEAQAQALSQSIEALMAMDYSTTETEPERRGNCPAQVMPSCTNPGATAEPDRLRAFELCKRLRDGASSACAGRPATSQDVKPRPEIRQMVGQLQAQRRQLYRLATQGQKQIVVFGAAGHALRKVTVDTQLAVAREVLKTEPDVAAVLSAAQAMRGTAFALSHAPAFKPEAPASSPDTGKAATAQSDGRPGGAVTKLPPRFAPLPVEALKLARERIRDALDIGDQLKSRLESLNQRLRLTRVPLERCSQGAPAASLSVSPDVSELDLAAGSSQIFSVSGGVGTPQAKAAPGLTRNLDGSFTFLAAATAEEGSSETLVFSDGSGKLTREVAIRIVAAGDGTAAAGAGSRTVDLRHMQTAVMALALGLKTQPPSDQEVAGAVTACLKSSKFSIEQPDLEHIPVQAFAGIVSGVCRAGG